MASILNDIKKILGLPVDDESFDADVLMHINSTISTLHQLGIGPDEGFSVEDASPTWADYLNDDKRFNHVKTYIYLKVRYLFDPPTTSFHLNAMKEQIEELEWRINAVREGDITVPVEGTDLSLPSGSIVIDGDDGDVWMVN